ncbi:MAG: hypothetical protein Q9174_006677, partial [Haloplaca sp. 1 TL-2023]
NGGRPRLALEHFKIVAQASEDFDDYLYGLHGGTEADLARRYMQRNDDPEEGRGGTLALPYGLTGAQKSRRQATSSDTESEDSEVKEKKRRRRQKKGKKSSTEEETEDSEAKEKRRKREKKVKRKGRGKYVSESESEESESG